MYFLIGFRSKISSNILVGGELGAMAGVMKAFGAGFEPPPKEEADDSQAKKKGKKKMKKANPKVHCGVIHCCVALISHSGERWGEVWCDSVRV